MCFGLKLKDTLKNQLPFEVITDILGVTEAKVIDVSGWFFFC